MRRIRLLALFAVVACGIVSLVWALGGDYPPGRPVGRGSLWPQGLQELFNRPERVHGYFVNAQDIFFYAGDVAAFNAFLADYASLKDTRLELILHVGRKKARSPWDKEDRDIDVDWTLYGSPPGWDTGRRAEPGEPFVTRVDLWVGRSIYLEDVKVPTNVTVKSGHEVDRFVWAHEKQQKGPGFRMEKGNVPAWLLEDRVKLMAVGPKRTVKVFSLGEVLDGELDEATGYRRIGGELWAEPVKCVACEHWIPAAPQPVGAPAPAAAYKCPLCGHRAMEK